MKSFAAAAYLCTNASDATTGDFEIIRFFQNRCILEKRARNKRKIFNDPVYGFIHIPDPLIFDLIEHPYFQRLRRIRQLGLTALVYPGANHTRFQHSLGAMHLMTQAIQTLRGKGVDISDEEALSAQIAILLHDIGHGPFSHALEESIIHDLSHEDLSLMMMETLNDQFDGKLAKAIRIFKGNYPRNFLSQLIVGQLDMDRLDYIQRDSFFSGVAEGTVGFDRIIKMLHVFNNELVIEEKGIYSVEKFILARRLLYWQVYFHKTVVSAEHLLVKILKRAEQLAKEGVPLFTTPSLAFFLGNPFNAAAILRSSSHEKKEFLDTFSMLDDNDILVAAKVWSDHDDPVLSDLCHRLINRNLFQIEIQGQPFDKERVEKISAEVLKKTGIPKQDIGYFVFTDAISNFAYSLVDHQIKILGKDNTVTDITGVSDILDQAIISRIVHKYILCYPKMND
ncbi:MAG: HD domain-containing protein [Chlorobi bacterium]|nr:HD domain-containing protein [Chlorobiota bacterium]